jgi:2-methylcitrate dehydratase PrpD
LNQAVTVGATGKVVDFVADTDGRTLPDLARRRAVAAIADTIGVTVAGASTDIADLLLGALSDAGPLAGSHQLLGTDLTGNALDAALFNGAAAHALDYDDVNHPGPMHPSCHIVPALLALSTLQPVSGADVVGAYIIGFEIDGKLGRMLNPRHYDRGWHATSTIGTVAAAAAGARLTGLPSEAIPNCLALAASSAAGLRGNIGSMAKPLHAGAAARAAVQAVLLARRGFTGTANILERRHGYLAAFGDGLGSAPDLLAELGHSWDIESEYGLGLKPYPCCGEATAAVEAALILASSAPTGDIHRIVVTTNERATRILTYPQPQTVEEARFSLPFCVATALINRRADLDAFSEAALASDAIRGLLPRVEHVISEEHRDEREYGAHVRITRSGGQEVEAEVPIAKGWSDRWLTSAEQLDKFLMCTRGHLSETAARELHDVLMRLDKIPNFADVRSRLCRI